jgi:hypothetical protein
MKRLSLLGVGVLVVLAATTAMTASASAVQPSNLPTGVKAFTGKSEGTIVYHGEQGNVECKEAEGTGEETSNEPPLGPFHIDFRLCELVSLKAKCTGLGETTTGTILTLGTWHLPFDREVGHGFTGLTVATLYLINTVHLSCGALVLIELKGELLCLDLKPTEATTKHSHHCTGKNVLEPNEEWCMEGDVAELCFGEWLLPKLEESVNHAAFKAATELALYNTTYGVSVTGMI